MGILVIVILILIAAAPVLWVLYFVVGGAAINSFDRSKARLKRLIIENRKKL
jgi:hypothetical protein